MDKLKELIEKGEGKTVEWKETLPKGNNLTKVAVAFSNIAGGKILIGVQDKTGKIVGVSEEDVMDFPDRIAAMIYDGCYPAIVPEIYIENWEGKKLVVVQIYPGSQKPYYLRKKGKEKGVYIRIGAVTKIADEEMIRELERQRVNRSFDEELCYDKTREDLEFQKLREDFRDLTEKTLAEKDLINLKILIKENNKLFPTNGGMMLAGKEIYFENARIKCARFRGKDMEEFIDQKEFSGPLYQQVQEAMKFAKIYIAKSGKVKDLQRIDTYAVPLEAIREALVNAIVHRDYSITGSDIKFAIFDDRIEITSPGALPKSVELEDILYGRSEIRNKVISRFFKEIRFIEEWGTGIPKMIQLCKNQGLKQPEFRESGLFFKVTLYQPKEESSPSEKKEDSLPLLKKVGSLSQKILSLIEERPNFTTKEIAHYLSVPVQKTMKPIQDLEKQGLITQKRIENQRTWQKAQR